MFMIALYIGIGLLALVIGFLVVMHFVGASMPEDKTLVCTLTLHQPPQAVYAAIADIKAWPTWDKGVNAVEVLPPTEGRETLRMHMGRNRMVVVRTRNEPPRLHEMTVRDEGAGIFSGTWTHDITPTAEGCTVTLTEHGRIHKTIPRAMARRLFDPATYLKRHLKVLAAKFGEEPRLG